MPTYDDAGEAYRSARKSGGTFYSGAQQTTFVRMLPHKRRSTRPGFTITFVILTARRGEHVKVPFENAVVVSLLHDAALVSSSLLCFKSGISRRAASTAKYQRPCATKGKAKRLSRRQREKTQSTLAHHN